MFKEFATASVQTDDLGCGNGCTSMRIDLASCGFPNCDSVVYNGEFGSVSVQTDDFNCRHGCTSMLVDIGTFNEYNCSELSQLDACIAVEVEGNTDSFINTESSNLFDNNLELMPELDLGNVEVEDEIIVEQSEEIRNEDSAQRLTTAKKPLTKSHECSHCKKIFTNKFNLTKHIRKHTGDQPFECSFCGRKFSEGSSLNRHLKIHDRDKDKIFECLVCYEKFDHKSSLKKHIKTNPDHNYSYICKFCNKKFAKKCDWSKHTRYHTGEKPYECSQCKKAFVESGHLRKHLACHSDNRRYFECAFCMKKFTQNGSLKRHLRTHSEKDEVLVIPMENGQLMGKLPENNDQKQMEKSVENKKPFRPQRKCTKRKSTGKHPEKREQEGKNVIKNRKASRPTRRLTHRRQENIENEKQNNKSIKSKKTNKSRKRQSQKSRIKDKTEAGQEQEDQQVVSYSSQEEIVVVHLVEVHSFIHGNKLQQLGEEQMQQEHKE